MQNKAKTSREVIRRLLKPASLSGFKVWSVHSQVQFDTIYGGAKGQERGGVLVLQELYVIVGKALSALGDASEGTFTLKFFTHTHQNASGKGDIGSRFERVQVQRFPEPEPELRVQFGPVQVRTERVNRTFPSLEADIRKIRVPCPPTDRSTFQVGQIIGSEGGSLGALRAQIVDPATAPDTIKTKPFANKSMALVQFFPSGEYAWLAPTRMTHLSVTQIEEFVANSRHKKPQLVNGYRKAAERAKKHNRPIAPPNLKGKRSKWGGGEEVFPIDNSKRKHQARTGKEGPGSFRRDIGRQRALQIWGPGGLVSCSDIAMTFELSLNSRIFNPTTLQGDADLLLAFFQGHGGARHFEYICYAHAMLRVVEEGLSRHNGNVTPKIEWSTLLGMVFQYVGDGPRAFEHATLRGDAISDLDWDHSVNWFRASGPYLHRSET
ncbi:hypothetical protein B0H13DRAFT_1888787 [Mycena leptocephala]|nr:hypothetical protein B0H13DRAFT_1888787 [Mycena leptocephala]